MSCRLRCISYTGHQVFPVVGEGKVQALSSLTGSDGFQVCYPVDGHKVLEWYELTTLIRDLRTIDKLIYGCRLSTQIDGNMTVCRF